MRLKHNPLFRLHCFKHKQFYTLRASLKSVMETFQYLDLIQFLSIAPEIWQPIALFSEYASDIEVKYTKLESNPYECVDWRMIVARSFKPNCFSCHCLYFSCIYIAFHSLCIILPACERAIPSPIRGTNDRAAAVGEIESGLPSKQKNRPCL